MQHYYIIKNKVTDFNYELNPTEFSYQKLTSEQVTFYLANPTASVSEVLNMTLNTPYVLTLDDLKQQKISQLQADFDTLLEQGYYDEDEEITIALLKDDRDSFAQQLTLIALAEGLGEIVPNQITVTDIHSVLHTLNLIPLKALLLRYGFYYQTIWLTLKAKVQAVNNATTEQEINAI